MNEKTKKVLPELNNAPFYIQCDTESGESYFSQQQSAAELLTLFEKNFRLENPKDEIDYDAVFKHIYDYLTKLRDGLDKGIRNLDFFTFEGVNTQYFFNTDKIECITLHNLVSFTEDMMKLSEFHGCD